MCLNITFQSVGCFFFSFFFPEGRRFISEDRKEGDVYDTLHLGKTNVTKQNCLCIFGNTLSTFFIGWGYLIRGFAQEHPKKVFELKSPMAHY